MASTSQNIDNQKRSFEVSQSTHGIDELDTSFNNVGLDGRYFLEEVCMILLVMSNLGELAQTLSFILFNTECFQCRRSPVPNLNQSQHKTLSSGKSYRTIALRSVRRFSNSVKRKKQRRIQHVKPADFPVVTLAEYSAIAPVTVNYDQSCPKRLNSAAIAV